MPSLQRLALAVVLTALPLALLSQQHPNTPATGKVSTFMTGDTRDAVDLNDSIDVYRMLVDNAPIEPEFRVVPRFAIVGSGHKFYFSVGANLKFTAAFDWGNPVRDPSSLAPNAITAATPGNRQLLQMTAQQSNVYFNIIGFPESANRVGLFISFGMDGEPGNTYKLHAGQVFLRYRHFQLGWTSSIYNDKAADAYLIDGHGPCASGSHDDIQILLSAKT